MEDVTKTEPIDGRKYTLTHSDDSGELYLTIGKKFAYEKIPSMRDEVLGQWYLDAKNNYYFIVFCEVDGQNPSQHTSMMRNTIFRQEMPLALTAIRYGDRALFAKYPYTDDAPIWIWYSSQFPMFNRLEYGGQMKQFWIQNK